MKTLKLASFAALFLFVIASCTKDSTSLSSTDSSARTTLLSGKKGGDTGAPGEAQGGQGQTGGPTATRGPQTPVLTFTQVAPASPAVPKVGESVTIQYTAANPDGSSVNCGRIFIYKVENGVYTEVASGNAPLATYTFTPTAAGDCAYQFAAGFAPGGGTVNCQGSNNGVDEEDQIPDCLKVDQCVAEFTIDDKVELLGVEGDIYHFKVTYTLTSPEAYDFIKFQGGATSGGQFEHTLTAWSDNLQRVNINKQNNVLKYEGSISACEEKEVWFTYKRKFKCPEVAGTETAVTGDWTVKNAAGVEVAPSITAMYICQ